MSGRPVLFLSHASVEAQTAQELKRRLLALPAARASGLEVFIDRDDLTPGRGWQEQLEQFIMERSSAFGVIVGAKGVVTWVESEVRTALSRATRDRNYPFIPVFIDADTMALSMQDASSSSLPPFVRQYHGVCDPLSDEKELAKLLRAVLGDTADNGAGRPRTGGTSPVSNIPIRVPTHFIGRDDALAAIEAAFRGGSDRLAVAITALHGLRGVGKSTLAAAYADLHRGDYRVTWWIRAQADVSLHADLVALGIRMAWVAPDEKEAPALAAVMEQLRAEGDGVLLIYDNAVDADALKPCLPRRRGARPHHFEYPCLARRRDAGPDHSLARGDRRRLSDRSHWPGGRAQRGRGAVPGAGRPATRPRAGRRVLRAARRFAEGVPQALRSCAGPVSR
jgi:hypothetical protein